MRKIEPKATVDYTQSDDDASEPDMSVRPECATVVLSQQAMVQKSKDWLEEY